MAQQTPTVPAGSAAEHEAVVTLQLRTAAMAYHLEKERDGRAVASPVPERVVREWARADAGDFAKLREGVHDQVLPVMANNMRINATYRSELEASAPQVAARVTAYDREAQAAFDAAMPNRQAAAARAAAQALTAEEVKAVERIDERHHFMIATLHKGNRFSAESLAKFAQSDARDFAMVSEGHKDAKAIAVNMRSLGEHYPEYRAALAAASPQMAQRVEALHEADEAQAGARKPAATDTPARAAPQLDGDDRLHREIERRAERPADMSAADRAAADAKAFRGIEKPHMQESAAVVMTDSGRAAPAYKEALTAAAPDVAQRVAVLDKQADAKMMAKEDRKERHDPLVQAALTTAKEQHLGTTTINPDDHATFQHEGGTYTVQQKAPGSFAVYDKTGKKVRDIGPATQKTHQRAGEQHTAREVKLSPAPEVEGVRLVSLGKGASVADIDEKAQQVVIRRSGRVVERLADEKAAGDFADKKGLSAEDRDALLKLAAARAADGPARDAVKATLGKDARAMDSMVNTLSQAAERGRVRAEVQQNDAQVYEWIERQRQLRAQQEPAASQAAPAARAVEGTQSIERQGALAAPDKSRAIPPEVGSQFTKDGDKYYHQQSKAVAFVDRGDKLSTPASTPKMAEALVKVAEARGWDEVRVQGTEGFRREVWLEASSRGMHVDGYTPTDRDKSELEKRNAFTRDQNTIQVRSHAFKQLPPDQGVQRDPSLASAYALVQAAEAFAQARLAEKDRQQFVTAVRAKVADDLQAGRPVPALQIRAPARESARQVEQANERVR